MFPTNQPTPASRQLSRPARRTRSAALVAIALMVLGAVASPTPISAASTAKTLEGTLELVHGEDFATGKSTYDYHLRVGNERVALKMPRDVPPGFVNGAKVRVKGRQDAGAFVALDGALSSTQVLASAPSWTGPRKLAVILINFSNDTRKPYTRAFANRVVFKNADSVREYYLEQSKGAVSITGTTFDWLQIPHNSGTCDYRLWADAAKAGLAARGIDLSTYTNFMFMFPPTSSCSWRGLAQLPGPVAWINGSPYLRVAAHELGHNLGVHHASSLRCKKNGVRVALSSNCTRSEYGDPFTTMGGAMTRHVHNLELIQIGYLPTSAARTVVTSGTYTLKHASATSGTRIISIPRGNGTFLYLEYRRPYGTHFDDFSYRDPAVRGVTLRLAAGWTQITQTQLIDTRPRTTTFADAPLRLDHGFRDYVSGVKVRVTSIGKYAAKVAITMPSDAIAPTAVSSFTATATSTSAINLKWGPSTDNRAVTGYRIWRDGVLLTTAAATATSLTDSGLAPSTRYYYTIKAIDGAGNLSAAVSAPATTSAADSPPTAPGNATVTVTDTTARLTWSAASDNLGVTGYRVWRNGALLGTTTSREWNNSNLTPETAYSWTIRAVDTAGQTGPAVTVTATTAETDVEAPTAPKATVAPENPSWASLTWTASTDNVGVVEYVVYRDGQLHATTGVSDRELRVARGSAYTVVAVDAAGNASVPSEPVSA
ncbi:MAG TPA: fibronectin type III domain-containing protein [Candidatus Limnocylindria bacterium]|nr:fibronectin type III domain-containing protein [Candidatus Limnocylindria bacterium]